MIYQPNDEVQSADECRGKFVARLFFHKLAKDEKLFRTHHENGPFKLWSHDFRPANILLAYNLRIVGIVDGEFTYAAPVAFSHAPHGGFSLENPEFWSEDIEDWTNTFERRLKTFLTAMRHCKDIFTSQANCVLSDQMQKKLENWRILNSLCSVVQLCL